MCLVYSLKRLFDDKKQQFIQVSLHAFASPWSVFIVSSCPLLNILSITLVAMAMSYHQCKWPSLFVRPLSGWCSISINAHGACWQTCGRMWAPRAPRQTECSRFFLPIIQMLFVHFALSSFSFCFGGKRVLKWKGWSGLEQCGSKQLCARRALSLGLQKVNYVLLGGSFCDRQCCLTVLGVKEKNKSVSV